MAPIAIDIALSDGFVNMVTGQVDNVRFDFVENLVVIGGRDLSARLIDAEISEAFYNQTSSQIAEQLAGRHGLAANVTTTSTSVGQYYELDHARSTISLHSRMTTEWNLLTQLAQLEGFALSVKGETLNFGPSATALPVFMTLRDMMTLEIDTATTLPEAATVKSWNTRSKTSVSQTTGVANPTVIVRPNLSAAQASAAADNHLAMLTRHKTILHATMPGDVVLAPDMPIALSGTGSPLDQIYLVDRITRTVGARSGFVQVVRAHAVAT